MARPFSAVFSRTASNLETTLPKQGLLYFDHLNAEYRGLLIGNPEIVTAEARKALDEIVSRREGKEGVLLWHDLYTFDLILTQLQPIDKLSRKVWNLRSRYRDVAGSKEYDAYLASKPPDWVQIQDDDETKKSALRADIEYLLSELYLRYAIAPVREMIRDQIATKVALVIISWLALAIIFTLLIHRPPEGDSKQRSQAAMRAPTLVVDVRGYKIEVRAATLTVVILVGAVGGLVSMQQRYQSLPEEGDQIHNVSELLHGKLSIFLPAVSGAIFAAVLYLLVLAGLLQGGLFPKMVTDPGIATNDPTGVNFIYFLREANPASRTEFAKLLVWSFIAGFAERFVPDTLSRFVAKKESTGGA